MTSTTNEKSLILKTDVLGRVRMPRERREAILDAFERSGMSGQAFAAHIGVKYPTFATWTQKRRRERGDYADNSIKPSKPCGVTLVEAMLESDHSTGKGVLEVESGQRQLFLITWRQLESRTSGGVMSDPDWFLVVG